MEAVESILTHLSPEDEVAYLRMTCKALFQYRTLLETQAKIHAEEMLSLQARIEELERPVPAQQQQPKKKFVIKTPFGTQTEPEPLPQTTPRELWTMFHKEASVMTPNSLRKYLSLPTRGGYTTAQEKRELFQQYADKKLKETEAVPKIERSPSVTLTHPTGESGESTENECHRNSTHEHAQEEPRWRQGPQEGVQQGGQTPCEES
jgi:hypothetical protein